LGDVLFGQRLAQPGMLVGHVFPFLQRRLLSGDLVEAWSSRLAQDGRSAGRADPAPAIRRRSAAPNLSSPTPYGRRFAPAGQER
jgi:hypothetical protein